MNLKLKWKKSLEGWSQGESVTVRMYTMLWTGTVKAARYAAPWEFGPRNMITLHVIPTEGGLPRQVTAIYCTHGIQQPLIGGCYHCGAPLTGRSHKKTCSAKCRKAMSRNAKA